MTIKLKNIKNKKGFTLVELIVVIAIIAILTAVLVPLVGRYSAQATYASLQDTAKSIANSTSYAIADVTKMGVICQSDYFTGNKTSGTLTISSFKNGESDSNASSTGMGNNSPEDFSNNEELVCAKLADMLNSAVPNGSNFRIEVENNAIISTIYSGNGSVDVTGVASDSEDVTADTEFDEAYTYNGNAVGVYGKYKS